jgi:DNA-binding Lrp family transcriptional regulator
MTDLPDIDEIDRRLMAALQDDARQTNRDLAAAVHVSTSTSSERIRALRAQGVIRGYHADIALEALGRHVQALIAVTIRPPSRETIEAFRDWAASLPELLGVFVVSGTQDFLLHVAVPDTDALYAFVIDRLTERPEIADVNTSVVYEHIRRPVLESLERASTTRSGPTATSAGAGATATPPRPPSADRRRDRPDPRRRS